MKRTRAATRQHASDRAAAQAGSKRINHHAHQDACASSDTHVHDQQGRQPAAQQLSAAGNAAADDDSGVATASLVDSDSCGSEQPAQQEQDQLLYAAAAAATAATAAAVAGDVAGAARLTVGAVCSSSSSRQLAAALRKWAELCHPGGYFTAYSTVDATPVAHLLPQMDKYLQYLHEQVAEGGKTAAAAKAQADQLLKWLKQLPGGAIQDPQASTAPASTQQQQHLKPAHTASSEDTEGFSGATIDSDGDTDASIDSDSDTEQQPSAAAAGAAGTVTVGQACSASSRNEFKAALRAWAKACYPDLSKVNLEAVPVVDLLPGLDSYLQHLRQRVTRGAIALPYAIRGVQSLGAFIRRHETQLLAGGDCSMELVTQVAASFGQFEREILDQIYVPPDAAAAARTAMAQSALYTAAVAAAAATARLQGAVRVLSPATAGLQTRVMQGSLSGQQQQQQLLWQQQQQQLLWQQVLWQQLLWQQRQQVLLPSAHTSQQQAGTAHQAATAAVDAAPAAATAAVASHVLDVSAAVADVGQGTGSALDGSSEAQEPFSSSDISISAATPPAAQAAKECAADLSNIEIMADLEGPTGEDDDSQGDLGMPDLGLDLKYLAATPAADNPSPGTCHLGLGSVPTPAIAAAATAAAAAAAQVVGAQASAEAPPQLMSDVTGVETMPFAAHASLPASEAALSPCTFAQLKQRVQQQPEQAEALRGYDVLWKAAQAMHGPMIDPAATEVRPLLLILDDPARLQDCRDSFKRDSSETCAETLDVLTGLQALLAQPVFWDVLGAQQQLQLLGCINTLADECRQHVAHLQHAGDQAECGDPCAQAGLSTGLQHDQPPSAAAAAAAADRVAAVHINDTAAATAGAAAAASAGPADVICRDATAAAGTAAAAPLLLSPPPPAAAAAAAGFLSGPDASDAEPGSSAAPAAGAVDVFKAQSILLDMCTAEQLLTRDELLQLRQCLEQLQGAAVQLGMGQQLQAALQMGLSRFQLSFEWVTMVQDEDLSTTEERREAVGDLLDNTIASLSTSAAAMSPPAAAATAAVAGGQVQAAATTAAEATAAAAAGQPAGCDSKWVAAERSLQEALRERMQQQQSPAQRRGVQCARRLVGRLALRDRMDVHARYLLSYLEWLQFCRVNPSGRMMPSDVQVALEDILSLAAAWA